MNFIKENKQYKGR